MEAPRVRIALAAYLHQEGLCPYCQGPVDPTNATWEHILPRAWGGPNVGRNVILACETCNGAKSAIESFISNSFGKELDMGSRAALFVMRAMKLNKQRNKKRKLPKGAYLRMALNMQATADDWIRRGQVAIPDLNDSIRGVFI